MTIEKATPDIIDELTELAVRLSMIPEHHIGYFGATTEEVTLSVRKLVDEGAPAVVARESGRLAGMLAVECDTEIGRGWLHGPLVDHDAWHDIADALFGSVVSDIPAQVVEFEIFCDTRNRRCIELAERHGYRVRGDWDLLTFFRHQWKPEADTGARPIADHQHASIHVLHDRLFPASNRPGAQMLRSLGEHARLLVIGEEEGPEGYIYLTVEPESGEAFIDFLGVDEGSRGRGIGEKLVRAGVDWLFGFPGVEQVALAVATDNPAARRLYEKAGFSLERSTRAFRKVREQ